VQILLLTTSNCIFRIGSLPPHQLGWWTPPPWCGHPPLFCSFLYFGFLFCFLLFLFFMCQAKVANLYMWSYFIGLTFSCAYMSQVPLRTLITRGVNPVRFPNFLAKTGNRNWGTPVPCFGKLEPEPGPGPR
jgi:hypothetical protein